LRGTSRAKRAKRKRVCHLHSTLVATATRMCTPPGPLPSANSLTKNENDLGTAASPCASMNIKVTTPTSKDIASLTHRACVPSLWSRYSPDQGLENHSSKCSAAVLHWASGAEFDHVSSLLSRLTACLRRAEVLEHCFGGEVSLLRARAGFCPDV
jgi:hypothetical protein